MHQSVLIVIVCQSEFREQVKEEEPEVHASMAVLDKTPQKLLCIT